MGDNRIKGHITLNGTLVVDRESLYKSDEYKRQVEALKEIVKKGIGKYKEPKK